MSEINELLLTTAQSSLQWTISAWDYNSGNLLQMYKNGGTASPKTLAILGSDYLVVGEYKKPLVHVWPLNSQEQVKNFRIVLPEPANCIAVSPNNCYLAVGIGPKLYLWQIESGKLLRVLQKHYQPVTCVKFSSDGDFVVVGGQDGMLLTYNFGDLVNIHANVLTAGQIEPLYKKMDHSRPILDVFIGNFGYKSRFATVSADHTCRIYGLLHGDLLLCLFFDEPLTSVIFNQTCWNMYAGGENGNIFGFNLKTPPRSVDFHVENPLKFIGHSKKITCLDLNVTGKFLASGSEDNRIIIWDTCSVQMLRQLDLKSPVTNIKFMLSCENMFTQQFKPKIILKSLERSVNLNDKFIVAVVQNEDICFSDDDDNFVDKKIRENDQKPQELNALESELENIKTINHQLYEYLLKLNEKRNKQW